MRAQRGSIARAVGCILGSGQESFPMMLQCRCLLTGEAVANALLDHGLLRNVCSKVRNVLGVLAINL